MDYLQEYKRKLVSPEEAVKAVKSGDWVEYGAFAGQVVELDKALAKRKDELFDVKIRGTSRLSVPEAVTVDPDNEHITDHSSHLGAVERSLC
ncbi:MAG: butyryl-CoA:acetate CoA-transferase, partial [Clostridiales Family XIII bacterium]|nr:butyryl-CoA:acetate CoA-transferase [Clostridiales Family XIII bacterium]